MRTHKKIFFCLGLLGLFLNAAYAKKSPKKIRSLLPTDCKVIVDSSQKLYDMGDPTYLTWDIPTKCDSAQLYTAYYYQGLGFYLLSAWKESLYFLSLAKTIRGPKDEEILYHIWNVNKKLNRFQEMERATLELHKRYPNSFFLMEILDQWKNVKQPSNKWSFGYSSSLSFSKNAFLDNVLSNRLSTATGQKSGGHHFREKASLRLNNKLDEKNKFQGFQADLGAEYEFKGLTAELNYGLGYDARNISDPIILLHNGNLLDSNWNWIQGHAALGYSYTTKPGWNLGLTANALQLTKNWQIFGLSHSQSFLFPDWILLGYLDFQSHNIKNLDSLYGIKDLNTFMANLTPYLAFENNSLGVGITYYFSRTQGGDNLGINENVDFDNSLTATASYSYDFRKWLKFNLGGSFGKEFIVSKNQANARLELEQNIWGFDAGFSLSY